MAIVLVTGGAGFIGSHLVERLLEAGAVVRVLDNLSIGSLGNLQPGSPRLGATENRRLEMIVGDVRDERLVRAAMRHVDCVFHLAAQPANAVSAGHLAEMHSVNTQGTLTVLQAALAEGVRRLVFASCGSVYGPPHAAPISEDDPPRPTSLFAASKLAGEIYCRTYSARYGLDTVLLRYFTVYGPRQPSRGGLVPDLLENLCRGVRPVIATDAPEACDLLHVDDAVAATIAAQAAPEAAGLSLNIASGESASVLQVVQILNRLLRSNLVPRRGRTGRGEPAHDRVSTELGRRVLGLGPTVSLVAGLTRLVESAAGVDQTADRVFV
jgi:UDP-glucose 4-epimerase